MPQPLYEQQARVRTKSLSKRSNGVGTEVWCGLNLGRAALNSMTWICAGLLFDRRQRRMQRDQSSSTPIGRMGLLCAPCADVRYHRAARGCGRKAGIHRIGASRRAIYSVWRPKKCTKKGSGAGATSRPFEVAPRTRTTKRITQSQLSRDIDHSALPSMPTAASAASRICATTSSSPSARQTACISRYERFAPRGAPGSATWNA